MAITVSTPTPQVLLSAIKKAIDARHIETWGYDGDGDFTHTAQQWKGQAWLRPSVQSGALFLTIIAPQGRSITPEVYGIYHGRFIEMLLAHFNGQVVGAAATPSRN